jgi:hypothetical protein
MKPTAMAAASLDTLRTVSPELMPVIASVIVVAAMMLLGLGLLRRADPATAFATGMGLSVLLLTMLGVLGLSLLPGLSLLGIAALASGWMRRESASSWVKPAATILVLLLPLLLLLSDRRGSEWDEFSHWLHAFRYLGTYYRLPGGPDAPTIASCCAAYPYAWPMVGAAAMALSGFSEAIPALLNTVVLGLLALLLGHLATEAAGNSRPGVGLWATALLFATVASPPFVHKLAFSAYADVITAFLVAAMVMTADRLAAPEGRDGPWRWGLAFGLIGGAVLAVKPGNAALFACTFGAAVVLAVRGGGLRALLSRKWIPALLLPLLVSAMWRWYVDRYLAGQEMGLRSLSEWNIHLIPTILRSMAEVASQKGGHFGIGIAVTAFGVLGLIRNRDRTDRICAAAGMLFVGYNLFLLTTYVAVFGAEDGVKVMSFWRYNTHVGMALLLPVAMLAGRGLGRFANRTWFKTLGFLMVAAVLAVPLGGAWLIRFDLDPLKAHYRQTLRKLPSLVPPDAVIDVLDADGSGLSRVVSTYEWNDRQRLGRVFSAFNAGPPRAWLDAAQSDWVIVLSGQARLDLTPRDAALLLFREGNTWQVVEMFPYPGGRPPERWP